MADENKYGSLKKFGAALTAAAALGFSSMPGRAVAEEEPPLRASHPATPAPIDQKSWTPEQRAVFNNIEGDLRRAGIAPVKFLYPFPESAPLDAYVIDTGAQMHEGFYTNMTKDGADILVGIAREGLQQKFYMNPPNMTVDQCPNNKFADPAFFERMRVLGYVHESMHKINTELHLTDRLKDVANKQIDNGPATAEKKAQWKAEMAVNIDERFADAGTAFYAKGNMADSETLLKNFHDRRLVDLLRIENHSTANSITLAAEAYDKNPLPRVSAIDAGKQAVQVLENQMDIIFDDVARNQGVIALHSGKYAQSPGANADKEFDARVRSRYQALHDAEVGLCNPATPADKGPPPKTPLKATP